MRAGLGLKRLALSVAMLASVLASRSALAQSDVETKELPPVEAPAASAPAAPTVSRMPGASSVPPAYEQPGGITPLPGTAPPASVDISSARIQWRLENPFRLFVEPAATDVHMETYEALDERQRTRAVFEAEKILSGRFAKGWGESVFKHICWDAARNQYSCKTTPDYLNPKSHRVIVELVDAPARIMQGDANSPPHRCEWRLTPLQGKRAAVPKVMTVPCAEPLAIEVPYPGGLRVSVRSEGPPIAEADISVQDLFIVGMGDSFGSGEGNPDSPVTFSRERAIEYGKARGVDLKGYPARVGAWERIGDKLFVENNARWKDQACHRSVYSYQLRTALQLAIENPQRAVTFVGYACSGAEIIDGLFQVYKGNEWVPTPPNKSQISFVAEAQCGTSEAPQETFPATYDLGGDLPVLKDLTVNRCPKAKARKIDLVLLSIGGNDIGFSRLVANTVLADKSTLRRLGGWFGQVHGFDEAGQLLDTVDERYKALKRALHNILHLPWAESDRVILTGYPPLALMEDGKTVCPDGRAGMTVHPDFLLSELKASESSTAAERLHDIMHATARTLGWSFVEEHRRAFQGRGVCAGFHDNALTTADDLRLPRKVGDAWHPFNPADWRAYVPRQRWFRTPNDAFMTGNFHVSASLLQKALKMQSLSWFQIMLAGIYSGAFHPTAEGQAAIADALADQARGVLAKYAREVGSASFGAVTD